MCKNVLAPGRFQAGNIRTGTLMEKIGRVILQRDNHTQKGKQLTEISAVSEKSQEY